MEDPNLHFIYCSECMHVYFQMPKSHECAICKNELSDSNTVAPIDLLICETCNHIYTIQEPAEIIPEFAENTAHLCGCKHNCPTSAILAVGTTQTYYGNIILADIYRCSNCKAVTLRNFGAQSTACGECGSKYLDRMNWNPDTHRIFFQCANPDHGIRLKKRDLIQRHNELIDRQFGQIKRKESELQTQYTQQRNFIQSMEEEKFLQNQLNKIRKKISPREKKLQDLNQKALIQRRELYAAFQPVALRCSIYQEQKSPEGIQLIATGDGCNALAHVKTRRVVIAPDGTVIDKEPRNAENEAQREAEEENFGPPSQLAVPQSDYISVFYHDLLAVNPAEANYLDYEGELMGKFAQLDIHRLFPQANTLSLTPTQLIIEMAFFSQKQSETDFVLVNHGFNAVELRDPEKPIPIGWEHFLSAKWKDPSFFVQHPYLFQEILPLSQKGGHFNLQKGEGQWLLSPNAIHFNPLGVWQDENLVKLQSPLQVAPQTPFILEGVWPFKTGVPPSYFNTRYQFVIQFHYSSE